MKKLLTLAAAVLMIGGVSADELTLWNNKLVTRDGTVPAWVNEGVTSTSSIEFVPVEGKKGVFAAKISCPSKPEQYVGIVQHVAPLANVPRPQPGEALKFTLVYFQKSEGVVNGGFCNMTFYDSNWKRLAGKDSKFLNGTFDWKEVKATFVFKEFPADTKSLTVKFFLGKTTGTVYFSEPKLYAEIIKQ